MDGVPHDDLPDGKVSVDPTGGPQGPYFDAPFENVDSDNDGLITWQQLCRSNPHIWLEDEKRVDFVDMFGHLDVKINKGCPLLLRSIFFFTIASSFSKVVLNI